MQAPLLQALVLAERVYEDKRSGGKIIAGTFHRVVIRKQPTKEVELADGTKRTIQGHIAGADMGSPWAYINVTDVVDETELVIQLMNVSKSQVLLEARAKLKVRDRLASIELAIPLPSLGALIKEPGTYSLDVLWNNEMLGTHRVIAVAAPEPPPPQQESLTKTEG